MVSQKDAIRHLIFSYLSINDRRAQHQCHGSLRLRTTSLESVVGDKHTRESDDLHVDGSAVLWDAIFSGGDVE